MVMPTHPVIGEEDVAYRDGQSVPAVVVLPRALLHHRRVDHADGTTVLRR